MATKTPTKTPAKSPAPPVKKVINMEPLKKANVPIIFIVGGNFVLIEMGILWGNWGGRSKQRWKEISSFSFQKLFYILLSVNKVYFHFKFFM